MSSSENRSLWLPLWAGLGVFLLCYTLMMATQVMVLAAAMQAAMPIDGAAQGELSDSQIQAIAQNGDVMAAAIISATPPVLLILYLMTRRKPGGALDFFGLRPVRWNALGRWLGYLVVFGVAAYLAGKLFDRPSAPQWMLDAHNSAANPWLLLLAVGVFAPLSEEALFRGYLLRQWSESWLGVSGSVLMLSITWAVIHLQYDLYDMAWIAAMSVLLCMSRIRTESVIPALLMHMLWNTFSYAHLVWVATQ